MTTKRKTTDVANTAETEVKNKSTKQIKVFVDESPLSVDVVNGIDSVKENLKHVNFDIVEFSEATVKQFKEHQVESLPTLVLFENDVERQRIIGKPLNLKEQMDIWANDFN